MVVILHYHLITHIGFIDIHEEEHSILWNYMQIIEEKSHLPTGIVKLKSYETMTPGTNPK